VASLSNYDFNLTYRAGKANGDADPLSRINPEIKQMFHDAIKAIVIVRKGSHSSMTNIIHLSLIKDISQRIIIRFHL
jgi:hypothetical protein